MARSNSKRSTNEKNKIPLKERSLPTSSLGRLWKLGQSLTKASGHLVKEGIQENLDKIKYNKQALQSFSLNKNKFNAAKEIIKAMGELKGGAMKIGQMLSITEDLLLPKEITHLFRTLQNTAPPMNDQDLNFMFKKNFNCDPEDIFTSFDRNPFAQASIGQVHKAKTKEGNWVAVKIQYPDIAKAITNDMKNLKYLDKLLMLILSDRPKVDNMVEELKNTIITECDYQKELHEMIHFRKNFQDAFPEIMVPDVYEQYSSKEILVQELMFGDSFEYVLQHYTEEEKNRIGTLLYESFLHCLFKMKKIHADPQYGNYLFRPGKIILLDYGAIKYFPDDFLYDYCIILLSIEQEDYPLFFQAGLNLKLFDQSRPEEGPMYYDFIKKMYSPLLSTGKYSLHNLNPFHLFREFVRNMNFKDKKAPRSEFLLLDRSNLGLFTKVKYLNAKVDWEFGRKKFRSDIDHEAVKFYSSKYPHLIRESKILKKSITKINLKTSNGEQK